MINYFETKAHPVTKKMVLDAYKAIRGNGKAAGVDGVSFEEYAKDLQANLYKLWNRLTSGSYFPGLTREKKIPKKGGGFRALGIATIEDRIAQQVVRTYLEPKIEPTFHADSYGYRPKRHAHQAIKTAITRCFTNSWVIDIDIKGYFDTIDHELLMKAVKVYTQEKWILIYIERWLKAGTLKEDGQIAERTEGTAQGSVISPLLSNVFLHFVFDKWMQKYYPKISFERYCDDMVIHCKSEKQASFIKSQIARRFAGCKLTMSEEKTKIVFCKNPNNRGEKKHKQESFDFLGFTFRPKLCNTKNGRLLLSMPVMSRKAKKSVMEKVKAMQIHKSKLKLRQLADQINEKTRGWINYYCTLEKWSTQKLWWQLNRKLIKWVKWNRGWEFRKALRWLKATYVAQPRLFCHWSIVKP
jgi:RNA-directed DNA polymerase